MKKWINLEEMKEQYKNKTKKNSIKKYLPKDTVNFVKGEKVENFNLYLNKIEVHSFENKKSKFPKIFSPQKNHNEYYEKIKKLNLKIKEIILKVDGKLSIGLGNASVYETSITLHHIYGVPYIPASAIKGSFRSYIIEKYKNEEIDLRKDWFVEIFGNQDRQGKVIFFDAFSDDVNIKKDIMNPHYPDYYGGKKPPTDNQNPRPINFLILKGKFKFIFGVRENFEILVKDEKVKILNFVKEELTKSLKEFGIGAKTSVGYGYFKEDE